MKLALRCIAIIVLFNCFVSTIRLLSFLLVSPDAREMNVDAVYVEIARSGVGLIFGFVLFKFAGNLTRAFGKDFDFEERLEVVNSNSMIAAIYAIFGIWLVAFSVPDLLEEIIRLQTSYYGASVKDLNTAIHKYSIVGDISRIIIGIVLIRYRHWLPPLNVEKRQG
jgi:hypothetical protein